MIQSTKMLRLHLVGGSRHRAPLQQVFRSAGAWGATSNDASHSNSPRNLTTTATRTTRTVSLLAPRGGTPLNHLLPHHAARSFHAGSVWQKDEKEDKEEKVASPDETNESSPPTPPADTPPREYSTPEITADAAKHKQGLTDHSIYEEERPFYQNPLAHENDNLGEGTASMIPPLDHADGRYSAPTYIHELAMEMCQLNMLEMNELTNKLQEHYGFADGMLEPDGESADGGADGDDDDEEGEAAAEKTAFDVKLVSFDAKAKIKVIKEVRALAGLGLKEAKEMVEGAPAIIQKEVKKEDAEEVKSKLEELGAVVEIV